MLSVVSILDTLQCIKYVILLLQTLNVFFLSNREERK